MSIPRDYLKLREEARPFISCEKDPQTRIATITLRRPDRQNAMTSGMRHLFAEMVHRANIDDEVKVLVLRGEGTDFGTGGDMPEEKDMLVNPGAPLLHDMAVNDPDVRYPPGGSYRYLYTLFDHFTNSGPGGMRPFQNFRKIAIVEVRGYCYGWHFYMAADADLVIASDDALFGHPSFRYAGWGARLWTWCEMVGLRKFTEMLLTGRPFTAAEMAKCGFVNSVVPADRLEEETAKYARACSLTRPTDTVAVQKTFLELYKQYRGEYIGAKLTAFVEGVLPMMTADAQADLEIDDGSFAKGLNNTIKDNDLKYPPGWRLSRAGRAKP